MAAAERQAWERLRAAELEVVQAQNDLVAVTNRKARLRRLSVIHGDGEASPPDRREAEDEPRATRQA